jgi:large subunit ribosomal protein L25
MSSSAKLECVVREKVGSRDARKLRTGGRVIASLQSDGGAVGVNLHLDEFDFLAARRQHVHLYDLEIGGQLESAVIRELQWDALGDRILHVEFKQVVRGVATEAEVELRMYGQVKDGVLTQNVHHIAISCIPSLIPDDIEVNVNGLEVGARITAADLELPEGLALACPPELEIAVVSAMSVSSDEPEPLPSDEETQGDEGDGAAPEGGSDA